MLLLSLNRCSSSLAVRWVSASSSLASLEAWAEASLAAWVEAIRSAPSQSEAAWTQDSTPTATPVSEALGKGFPKEAWDKGFPKAAWDKGFPKAAWDKGFPKAAWDKGFLREGWDKGFPREAWDKGFPKEISTQESLSSQPQAAFSLKFPTATR
jgi:hypothetical protein